MNKAGFLAGALALFWCSIAISEPESPPPEDTIALLNRMTNAVHYLDYEGSVVYAHGDILEAMWIAHTEQDGYEREQLIALTGAAHQIVRDNYTMTRFQPERKAVSVEQRHGRTTPTLVSFDPERVGRSYTFEAGSPGRIAGRTTQTVVLSPKDSLRYGYRLHIDAKYALPLKFDVLDHSGKYISQLMFSEIRIRHETPESIQAATARDDELQPAAQDPYDGPWRFNAVPAGFELEFVENSDEKRPVQHFVFSDGMAAISVYIEPDDAPGLKGHQQVGAVAVLGSTVDGNQVTVVGEVPVGTLEAFMQGISLSRDGSGQ